ncbi:MAG TPA: twin-arginine translocase subunit TatC, partial [Candidatus Limnocylindria bacterium]|nr:twin-arginine translocase subunit TatC [Candidatus Limnocylindria bacterium]
MTDAEATMSLIEHLEELRRRLIIIVGAILLAAVAGFIISRPVLDLLRAPLPDQYETLVILGPADALGAQLKIAGFLGIAFAMPVILFEVW